MLWVKAFHIVAVVSWFAGLFYLPRLFVYHAMTEDQPGRERFKIMERKLYRGIMTPAAVVAIALGVWMLVDNWAYYSAQRWVHIKLALVLVLIVYHLICGKYIADFKADKAVKNHVFFRWFNEFPVFLLIGIVLLVVLKQPV